ncbi:glutamyl-tRNA synthetase [Lindgomyces ingoldianus]|uniref:Glutamyl-tRNA synthetase n=1 Tax=Lindgomyces ingoldianus TaxID=673940 RepID=A0ACB6R981_9PLEO|nr:glutamyl-tRNA synthetase [Lindgomyces ingoldianus]KAF2475077.1 glutamyl-tRNA synthetase [Lindgomyces ingoldianus]
MSFPLPLRGQLRPYTCRSCLIRLSKGSGRSFSSNKLPRRHITPDTPARTRFAPSPTGYLHLGSLRTALFNYLLAKHTGGQFLLRIEDTDQKRTVPDAEERLLRDLRWAGLQWDEGPEVGGPYGPYKQSERSQLYKDHAQKLLDLGHGYRCFCTPERLHQLAESRHALGLATDYDRACAGISREESDGRASRGEKHVVRLRVPDEYLEYDDLVYGTFKPLKQGPRADQAFEDPILLKSDGLPTYHLANVVDDHHMHITHVIRGSEWMPSTPKHIAMYAAFGWEPPAFAHVGLLVDEQGNKLSKRNFDTDISAFKEMEIFPEALTNFAALLGWSHKAHSDVMDLQNLVETFMLKFTKGNTTVTFGKLYFLQRKHAALRAEAAGSGLEEMVQATVRLLQALNSPYQEWEPLLAKRKIGVEDYIRQIIQSDASNYTNANEFLRRNAFMFKPLRNPSSFTEREGIPSESKRLSEIPEPDWNKKAIKEKVWQIIEAGDDSRNQPKQVFYYLRTALTGTEEGMRIYDVMVILGRRECLRRLGAEVGGERR